MCSVSGTAGDDVRELCTLILRPRPCSGRLPLLALWCSFPSIRHQAGYSDGHVRATPVSLGQSHVAGDSQMHLVLFAATLIGGIFESLLLYDGGVEAVAVFSAATGQRLLGVPRPKPVAGLRSSACPDRPRRLHDGRAFPTIGASFRSRWMPEIAARRAQPSLSSTTPRGTSCRGGMTSTRIAGDVDRCRPKFLQKRLVAYTTQLVIDP